VQLQLCRHLLNVAGAALWVGIAAAKALPPQHHDVPTVAGWVETITFPEYNVSLDALLDTGADLSSLGVTNLHRFKKDGKPWLRFNLTGAGGNPIRSKQLHALVHRLGCRFSADPRKRRCRTDLRLKPFKCRIQWLGRFRKTFSALPRFQ
jgi:hypothetical protein